jgi:hypothetical protein
MHEGLQSLRRCAIDQGDVGEIEDEDLRVLADAVEN